LPARPSLGPPRGLPRKPSSFSRLTNNFVSPDKPTSVTGGDTLFGSGIAAPKRPHVIEDRSDRDLYLHRDDGRADLSGLQDFRVSGGLALRDRGERERWLSSSRTRAMRPIRSRVRQSGSRLSKDDQAARRAGPHIRVAEAGRRPQSIGFPLRRGTISVS
jgi:hypothetical protein